MAKALSEREARRRVRRIDALPTVEARADAILGWTGEVPRDCDGGYCSTYMIDAAEALIRELLAEREAHHAA